MTLDVSIGLLILAFGLSMLAVAFKHKEVKELKQIIQELEEKK